MTRSIKILFLLILFNSFYAHSMKTALSNKTIVSELSPDPRLLLELPDEILGTVIKCTNKDDVFNAIKMLIQVSWICKKFEHLSAPDKIKTILNLDQKTLDCSFNEYAFFERLHQEADTKDDFTPFLKLLIAMSAQANAFCRNLSLCVSFATNAYVTKHFIMHHDNKIDQQNEDGETPLYWAINLNKPDMVKVLLEHNANMYLPNNKGKTPTYWALLTNKVDCLKILIEHGLDTSIKYDWGYGYKPTIAERAKEYSRKSEPAEAKKWQEIYALVTGEEIPSDTCIIS